MSVSTASNISYGTAQYLRKCSVQLANNAGDVIELSDLHVRFTVHQADTQTPAHADIRVYNLSDQTSDQLQNEFTQVSLSAGYETNFAQVFSGVVRQIRRGRENATDTYLDILAQDGDQAYNWATFQNTPGLGAGWKQDDLLAQVANAMAPHGIVPGYTPTFGAPPMPRGKVLWGMVRNCLQDFSISAGTSWHLSNGKLNMVPNAGSIPGTAVVLTSDTGLIGLPQQTIDGITVKCLINPQIKHGGTIRLDNSAIQTASLNVAYSPSKANLTAIDPTTGKSTFTDNDGLYKVCSITMTGDNRGHDWYFDMICVGLNATAPIAGPFINAVASSNGF